MAIVIIATLWTLRNGGGTDSAHGSSQKQEQSPGDHFAALTWKASASPVVGYNVYRAEDPKGPYTKLNRDPVSETTYKDAAVQSGHLYSYMVTAVDAKGHESGFSNQVGAAVP